MLYWVLLNSDNTVNTLSNSYVEGWMEIDYPEEIYGGDLYDPITGTFSRIEYPPYVPPLKVKPITEDYTTDPYNDVILADTTSGNIEVTLVAPDDGVVTVSKIDQSPNKVTVIGMVNGTQDFVIDRPNASYTFSYSSGSFFITGLV